MTIFHKVLVDNRDEIGECITRWPFTLLLDQQST